MKKILVLLLLAAIVAPAFADDAIMLPQSVWRVRLIPSATFQSQIFDEDGNREALEDSYYWKSAQIYNLSFALEYGVNDWITAAAQWTPGWRFASSFGDASDPTAPLGDNDKVSSTGLNDLFLGAKFQIVGEQAPVPNDMHRFAAATGMKLPLSTYDAEAEAEAYLDGDEYQLARVDKDAYGFGYRLYYDYIVNSNFFVNLYNEFIYYAPRDLDVWEPAAVTPDPNDPTTWSVAAGDDTVEHEYGYDLTVEMEPQYSTMIGSGLELGASLPITFTSSPETKVDGEGLDNESYTLSLTPSVNLFFQSAPWPIDLELTYSTPIVGKNDFVSNTVALQIKNYLKFW
ncbi:MAG: hypothetical protein ACLFPP_11035 [Spirochaetaceae bacterium]